METYTVACIHCGWEGQDIDDHGLLSCRDGISRLLRNYQMEEQRRQADSMLAIARSEVDRYEQDWEFGGEAWLSVYNLATLAEVAISEEFQTELYRHIADFQSRLETTDWAIEQHNRRLG